MTAWLSAKSQNAPGCAACEGENTRAICFTGGDARRLASFRSMRTCVMRVDDACGTPR